MINLKISKHRQYIYDLHDKNWIPHIAINYPSNSKASTKNTRYQETFFDQIIQLEQYQLR